MAENFNSTTDFHLKTVTIYSSDESKSLNIRQLVQTFSYVESVYSPSVMGIMTVVDSAGLINELPIQGGEIIEIGVSTNIGEQSYRMRVWKIGNRYVKNQDQAYTLGLVSEEVLNNEFTRVETPLRGKPDEIIAKLLREYLKTSKQFYSDKCMLDVNLIASRKRIFDIVSSLMPKSVLNSQASPATSSGGKNEKLTNTEKNVSGSAGFFFWENKRGYNFFAVDTLCSEAKTSSYNITKPWGPYVEKYANQSDGADDRFSISSVLFTNEIDILNSLRTGKFSTKICTFNHSTGQYDEYIYNMKNAFDDMKHLGSQSDPTLIKLKDSKTIADQPTRIISFMLDHETWYNDAAPASPNPKDGSTSPSKYADWQLNFAAQGIARYDSIKNQMATIVVPGNSEICAGDQIEIYLLNKLPNRDATREPYDPENSGVYLVNEVTHTYDTTIGTNGRFSTTIRVMRDSFGIKNRPSVRGNK